MRSVLFLCMLSLIPCTAFCDDSYSSAEIILAAGAKNGFIDSTTATAHNQYNDVSEKNNKKKRDTFSVYLRGGYDFPGSYGTTSGSDWGGSDVVDGFSLSGEIIRNFPENEHLKAGVGLGYQFPRNRIIEPSGGSFYFVPVYATLYFIPFTHILNNNSIFMQFEFGVNYHGGNSKYKQLDDPVSGKHYGIGLGAICYGRYIVDIKITSNTGKLKWIGDSRDIEPTGIYYITSSLSLGIIL